MRSDLSPIEQEIKDFADGRWPHRSLAGRLRKLGEEVGELAEAVVNLHMGVGAVDEIITEAADCRIVLADLCALLNRSLDDATRMKMEQNRARPTEP